ncbi:MAG TPA: HAMP domain-containing sensor histidine kinase, partial [Sphingomonas sp.]|nr:HAMP domain-containing sensor histidine kinase [Sphingomonas sp.]
MRFDDMLATVLARSADRPTDRVAQWRQLIDLLAQRRPGADPRLSREAFVRLQSLRAEVPVAIRRETARTFAGRRIPAALVAFLAADVSAVAAMILPHARLDDREWLSILPRLSPTGRGILRHRRDLGAYVEGALAAFGASDLTLGGDTEQAVPEDAVVEELPPAKASPATGTDDIADILGDEAPTVAHGAGEGQIRAIITRIARFRKGRDGNSLFDVQPVRVTSFRFETGTDGVIRWVDGAPRGPLVGETIAVPATGAFGVDAQAPGAFRRRAPFRDARLLVAGNSGVAGEWRFAGVPVFAPEDGRFLGYRGIARRPTAEERAEPDGADAGLYGGGLAPDSLRQLVHELRTPLNAIGGFAEMIRRQMRGPISTSYRDRAQSIAENAGRLLAAVDDLDVAARLETHKLDLQHIEVDLGAMLGLICSNYTPGAERRGVVLECGVEPGLPPVGGDPAALRRMAGRLIAASTALADERETIRATLIRGADPQMLELSVG